MDGDLGNESSDSVGERAWATLPWSKPVADAAGAERKPWLARRHDAPSKSVPVKLYACPPTNACCGATPQQRWRCAFAAVSALCTFLLLSTAALAVRLRQELSSAGVEYIDPAASWRRYERRASLHSESADDSPAHLIQTTRLTNYRVQPAAWRNGHDSRWPIRFVTHSGSNLSSSTTLVYIGDVMTGGSTRGETPRVWQRTSRCIDLARPGCAQLASNGVLNVFVRGRSIDRTRQWRNYDWVLDTKQYGDPWLQEHIHFVGTADAACIIVAGELPLAEVEGRSGSWNGGRNHFLPYVNWWTKVPGSAADNPASPFFTGCAMLGHTSLPRGAFRDNFDLKLPLIPLQLMPGTEATYTERGVRPEWANAWRKPVSSKYSSAYASRPLLAMFKGEVQHVASFGYRDRWLVIQTQKNEPGVFVEETGKTFDFAETLQHPASRPGPDSYENLMLSAKFVLCMSGAGVHSYRFYEALQAGAVPVVTDDTMLPFESSRGIPYPRVKWNDCVVRIGQQKLAVVATILRGIGEARYAKMRASCGKLYAEVLRSPRGRLNAMYRGLYDVVESAARN